MTQPILLKVYGGLRPVSAALHAAISEIAFAAMPSEASILLDGEWLEISFEGIYFPVDELIMAIETAEITNLNGKIDVLDIENWQLRRFLIVDSRIEMRATSLNNVLAYSGH